MISNLHIAALNESKVKLENALSYATSVQTRADNGSATLKELSEDGVIAQIIIDLEIGIRWINDLKDDLSKRENHQS